MHALYDCIVLIAQAVFLLEHGHEDIHKVKEITDAILIILPRLGYRLSYSEWATLDLGKLKPF